MITDTSAFDGSTNDAPSTTSTSSPVRGTGQEYSGGVLGDTLYLKDYLLVKNVYGHIQAQDVDGKSRYRSYWLASRQYYINNSNNREFDFYGRNASSGGGIDTSGLRSHSNSGWSTDYQYGNRVRPILTLKSGLTVKSGSGTKASPYVFN